MTAAAIATAIRTRFVEQVVPSLPTGTAVAYDNFNVLGTEDKDNWVRFSVLFGDTHQISCGPTGQRRFRTVGLAVCEVYLPIDSGDEPMLAIADTVVAAFRGVTIEPSIVFDSPSLTAGQRDGPSWKRNIQIPFRADEYV